MKGKQVTGVGTQYSCTVLPRNLVYPALLTTIKTYKKLPSSMVSCVGAVPYTMLIQPEQHFTFSDIAGWVLVELYIVVGRTVDRNN